MNMMTSGSPHAVAGTSRAGGGGFGLSKATTSRNLAGVARFRDYLTRSGWDFCGDCAEPQSSHRHSADEPGYLPDALQNRNFTMQTHALTTEGCMSAARRRRTW